MKRFRNVIISLFVIAYTLVFHYESLRSFYLEKWFQKDLPKVKLLFPPAGWIMFYQVGQRFGHTDIYGVKGKQKQHIDSHEIFRVRTIGYDNIHRGIMGTLTYKRNAKTFCNHMFKNFDYFDEFYVVTTFYPNFVEEPYKQEQYLQYRCVP